MRERTRGEVIAKVRKLLSLASDNPSRSEAAAAALKAQRLIALYDVDDDELHEESPGEVVEVASKTHLAAKWCDWLACAIADNFRCRTFSRDQGRRRTYVFVGHELDAQAACLTFGHLQSIGTRLVRRAELEWRQRHGSAAGVRNVFCAGFVKGIREELERGSKELMLVRQPDVDEYWDARTQGFTKRNTARRTRTPDDSARLYAQGSRAGRDAVQESRLGGKLGIEA